MKLRQKLTAVLAASMVVTSIPVVTMADTSNSIHSNVYVRDGETMGYTTSKILVDPGVNQTTETLYTVNSSSNSLYKERYITNLEMYPKDNYKGTNETFYVSLTDGEFNYAAYAIAMYNLKDKSSEDSQGNAKFTEIDKLGDKDNNFVYYVKNDVLYKATAVKDNMGNVISAMSSTSLGKVEDLVKNKPVLVYDNGQQGTLTFTITDKKEMKVDVAGDWYSSSKTGNNATSLYVPLLLDAKSTQVKVAVDGSDSFVSSGEYVLGTKDADGKEIAVTADDAQTAIPVDGGSLSDIIITEQVLNAVKNSENRQIKLTLPSSSDAEFSLKNVTATGKRGFGGKKATPGQDGFKVEFGTTGRNDKVDRQTLIVTLPNWVDPVSRGTITLEDLTVVPEEDKIKTGELTLKVESVKDDDFVNKTSFVAGVVAEYGATISCEKPVSIKAGRSGLENDYSVKFVLEENVEDSIADNRSLDFKVENGYIISPTDVEALTGEKVSGLSATSSAYKTIAKKAVQEMIDKDDIKFEDDAEKSSLKEVSVNAAGEVIGFTLEDLQDVKRDEQNKLTITMPVAATLSATGEVKVIAAGRALAQLGQEKEVSCKVADIVSPVKFETKAAELKVGLQSQTSGEIVITETDKGMIEKGTLIIDANPAEQEGIKFQTVPKVEGTNLKIKDVELSKDKRYIYIDVTQTSTEAGSIKISDMKFTTDRTVPEGSFDLRVYGDAITDEEVLNYKTAENDMLLVKDFIKITTPNTEDIKNSALKAVETVFTLDSQKYTVDGVEQEMDAAAYAQDGRIMVPVRYIAKAFGVAEESVLFANGTVTIIAGEKIIQLTVGSNIMNVNGTPIQMDTKMAAKNGRTYVPMSYIGAALGVSSKWDATAKTATFSNKK